ncbi:MAG: TonB-dependent receptor [Marinobacter sp.]|uniref:TonB-dependent receptor plug domain-containing protein n=1 Tax=Marinobacter sp. TaxID=50741 RepID=UPI00299DF280|nr:TonB-dependent receptor [Marinobacter sp.]MDX1755628.1 TonB-dependent receptor [Marinobacter sp.]
MTVACQAQSQAVSELAALPLDQLLSISVSTASKLPSTVTDSPGIITVYSAEEIELFGGRDLGEVLARLPGIAPYNSATGHKFRVAARGDAPRLSNNHILVLLDGIPFNRESYTGGLWTQSVFTTMPLEAVRQIEVIRGPGSVLYGTNAFSGVVNIITKHADELENGVTLGAGNNDAVAARLTYGAKLDDADSEVVTALRYYDTEGAPLSPNDSTGPFRGQPEERSPGGLVSARSKGFHATLHWGNADLANIRGSDAALADGNEDNERLFVNLGYEHQLSNQWLAKADVSHVNVRTELIEPTAGVLGPINYKTDDSRIELQLQGQFSDDLQLVAGMTYDAFFARVDDPYPFLSGWRSYLYGAYAQLEYQWRNTRFTGGLQFNKVEGIADKTVPRVGLIHHFTETFGAKMMYAEAFRAPYAVETDVALITPGVSVVGNPDLRRELVETWDLQLFYNRPSLQTAFTLFHTRQEDLIVRGLQAPGVISFFNEGELDTKGVELEAKYTPHPNWFFTGSATWQRSEDGSGTEDVTLQPNYTLKAGAGYRGDSWSLALFDIYQDSYQDNVVVSPARLELNPASRATHLLSLNGTLELQRIHNLKLGLYVHNLLDEEIWLPTAPGFTTSNINTMPSVESGRTFLITAKLPF